MSGKLKQEGGRRPRRRPLPINTNNMSQNNSAAEIAAENANSPVPHPGPTTAPDYLRGTDTNVPMVTLRYAAITVITIAISFGLSWLFLRPKGTAVAKTTTLASQLASLQKQFGELATNQTVYAVAAEATHEQIARLAKQLKAAAAAPSPKPEQNPALDELAARVARLEQRCTNNIAATVTPPVGPTNLLTVLDDLKKEANWAKRTADAALAEMLEVKEDVAKLKAKPNPARILR